MNATQTLVLEAVTAARDITVAQLVEKIGKSETTIRKALKDLQAGELVDAYQGHWSPVEHDEVVKELSEEELVIEADAFYGDLADFVDDHDQHATVEAIEAAMAAGEAESSSEPVDQPTEDQSTSDQPEAAETAPIARRYQRHATPTTRTVRTNQITGAELQVLKNGEKDRDGVEITISLKWAAKCLTHGIVGQFSKVLDAHFASSYPTFCPTCANKMTDDQIGRRRKA